MAKTKLAIEDLDSCTIEDTNNLEMMRPSDSEKPPYAARVGKIEADHENNMKLLVRLYCRLVDSVGEQGYSRPVATSV